MYTHGSASSSILHKGGILYNFFCTLLTSPNNMSGILVKQLMDIFLIDFYDFLVPQFFSCTIVYTQLVSSAQIFSLLLIICYTNIAMQIMPLYIYGIFLQVVLMGKMVNIYTILLYVTIIPFLEVVTLPFLSKASADIQFNIFKIKNFCADRAFYFLYMVALKASTCYVTHKHVLKN